MAWLVIGAMLLAVALQSNGLNQRSAYIYQMKNDLDGVVGLSAAIGTHTGQINDAEIAAAVEKSNKTDGVTITWGTVSGTASSPTPTPSPTSSMVAEGAFRLARTAAVTRLSSASKPLSIPAVPMSLTRTSLLTRLIAAASGQSSYVLVAHHAKAPDVSVMYFFDNVGSYQAGLNVIPAGQQSPTITGGTADTSLASPSPSPSPTDSSLPAAEVTVDVPTNVTSDPAPSSSPTATADPSSEPAPTFATASPSAPSTATATPVPSATDAPTAAATATSTAAPTTSPTATTAPTATATPVPTTSSDPSATASPSPTAAPTATTTASVTYNDAFAACQQIPPSTATTGTSTVQVPKYNNGNDKVVIQTVKVKMKLTLNADCSGLSWELQHDFPYGLYVSTMVRGYDFNGVWSQITDGSPYVPSGGTARGRFDVMILSKSDFDAAVNDAINNLTASQTQ